MSKLEDEIISSLKEILSSIDSVDLNTHSGISRVLHLRSLKCMRKNEFSQDEIKIHMFWLSQDGEISGVFDTGLNFKEGSEKLEIGLDIELNYNEQNNILCLVIYEEDVPALFDPHDLLGVVAFLPNLNIVTISGSKITDEKSLKVDKVKEITLDAASNGCYRIDVSIRE